MQKNEVCHVADTAFREELGQGDYAVEDDRYWLYSSKLCPFAHRTEITRALLGLEDRIGLTIADPVQTEKGWDIGGGRYESSDSAASPLDGVERLPGVYELASPGYAGRSSVPVLFDTRTRRIVNNESAEIIRQLALVFEKEGGRSLYPAERREEIDAMTAFLEDVFIAPIYRAGFARDQATYDQNFDSVFFALDELEVRLSDGRTFLLGEDLTLADVHAFPHLARFDGAYHSVYRLNARFIRDCPRISEYLTRLGRIPAFGDTLDVEAMKRGYFLSWNQPTEGTFVPTGPAVDPKSGVSRRHGEACFSALG